MEDGGQGQGNGTVSVDARRNTARNIVDVAAVTAVNAIADAVADLVDLVDLVALVVQDLAAGG